MRRRGIWLELTTLIIPGLNDDRRELTGHGRVDRHGRRAGDALAPDPLPARLPAGGPAADAGGHARRGGPVAREVGLRHVYVGNAPEVEIRDHVLRAAASG
jgi:pyruvate formate lyase activating enzyme